MTTQTFAKPVVTVPRQPRPMPRYEGLFLEPALPPLNEDTEHWDDEPDTTDN